MPPRRRRGLTLIELLVVFIVLAMLVGLLLPAIGHVRESARRSQCLKNQLEIAAAIIAWEQQQARYPGYQNVQRIDRHSGQAIVTGWVFPLLPRLGRADLAQPATPTETRPRVRLRVLICPTSQTLRPTLPAEPDDQSHYVVNCGLRDQTANRVEFPGDWPANGVFQSRVAQAVLRADVGRGQYVFATHLVPPLWKTVDNAARDVQRGDGLSQTLMLSENVDCRGWTEAEESQVGFIWQASFDPQTFAPAPGVGDFTLVDHILWPINQSIGQRPSDPADISGEQYRYARPSSYHTGGVVVAFCDGHTYFLSQEIDYLVYALLMSSDGRNTRVPGQRRLLRTFNDPPTGGYQTHSVYALTPLAPDAY